MYIDFDNRKIETAIRGELTALTFEEAIAQGIVTQEELDKSEERFLHLALFDLEDAGYEDVTEEANKQNKSNCLYVFTDPSGVGVHYCNTVEDVLDLAERL